VAPVTGILSKRNVEPGQVVQAGQPLFSIVDLDNIWVTANFKETQLKNMHPGQKVDISVDAYGHTYKGTVESIAGASGARFSLLPPENATGNYVKVVQRIPVRIEFDKGQDPNHMLRPGMSVEPTVFVK
jgi:membrane fusion protein (multidrug efflux system)